MAPGGNGTSAKRPKPSEDDAHQNLLKKNIYKLGGDDDEEEAIVTRSEKEKAPPYFIADKDLVRLRNLANNAKVNATYKLTSQGIKVVTPTMDDYNKLGLLLKKQRYQFYTHDLPSARPFKVVIRGLGDFGVDAVTAALKRENLVPLKVFKMTRKDQQQRNYRDHLFLVHFQKGTTTLKRLKEIKALDQVIVQWEKYRGANRSVTQCQNCLAFGHDTRNCSMKTKCSNCGGTHNKEDCIAETKCGNCKDNHQGTDAKCPARNQFIEIRKKASGPRKPTRTKPDIDKEDFPPLVPGVEKPKPKPTPPEVETPGSTENDSNAGTSTSKPLFSPEELIPIFLELTEALNSCATRADQLKTLGLFIIKCGR